MTQISIGYLLITNHVADKLWSHGIVPAQLRSVLFGRHVIGRNRGGRAAPFPLIGRDEQGRCLTAPIIPTDDPLVWRVVTAWYCKPDEAAKLRQWRRLMEEPISYKLTQEPLDDEERELMNAENWDWDNPIEAVVHEDLGIIMPIEVSFEEYGRLEVVARAQGLTPHEFMKRTAMEAALAIRS